MATKQLTPKQQRFVQEYAIDLNATAAAKRAGYSEKTAYSVGHEILKKPEIAGAIQAAQAEHRERTKVTVDGLTEDLRAAYDLAEKNGQSSAMTQAALGIAKLHGMLVDKQQQLEPRAADMTPDALAEELERVQAELAALEQPAGQKVPGVPTEH